MMCIVAISIHQVYIFTFFPMVIIVLIYNSLSDKMKFQSSKILIITTTFFTICAFLVFQFYKVTKYPDMETLTQAISSYTNITPVSLLSYDYFFNFNDHANLAFKNLRHNIFAGIYTVTILLPLIIGFRFIWHFSSNASSSKNLGGIYRISFFAPLAAVPVFILTIDWGRWFAAVLITQFVLLIYYLANDDENVYLAISSLRERLSLFKPSLYLGILLVFHMLVGRFEAAATLGSADKFIKLFSKLLNILATCQ
ncbi:MAG TPA: hypothetical protein GX722_05395 [Clostridiales bacterium]|nr:hypothetical protein [Clostridiales bacterium]